MLFGLLNLSFVGYIFITLIFTQITIAGVTLYLHRNQTHQAVSFHPIISHFFRFWLWLTTGMVTREWVAIHRKHHAKSETPEDPHSPKNWGLKTMLLKGAMVYRTAKTKETIDLYGYGTPNDWIEKNVYTKHQTRGIFLMLFIDLVLFGLVGGIVWLIQIAWIPFWAAGVVNGVGHCYGYRNFETNDNSTNIMPWGFFIGGEELHNNHHAFSSSAKFSVKWWEFDIGWLYLSILSFFRLATVKRKLVLLKSEKIQKPIDFNLVKTMINNRLQVITDYNKKVIFPSFAQEKKDKCFSSKARKLFVCSDILSNKEKEKEMMDILEKSSLMKVAYQFKVSLQKIWENPKLTPEELVNALKQWIEAAQHSGNIWLTDFTRNIYYKAQ